MVVCGDQGPGSVRTAASAVAKKLIKQLNVLAVPAVLPIILDATEPKNTWQTKVLACELVGLLTTSAKKQMAAAMPIVFPNISHTVSDAKVQVKVILCSWTRLSVTVCVGVCDLPAGFWKCWPGLLLLLGSGEWGGCVRSFVLPVQREVFVCGLLG